MKKLLIMFLLSLSIGCATTNKYAYLNSDYVKENCNAVNVWNIRVIDARSFVAEFKDCGKIKYLTLAAVAEDDLSEEIRRQTLNLIKLHYKKYLSTQVDKQKIWQIDVLKEQIHIDPSGGKWLMMFFEVKSQVKK